MQISRPWAGTYLGDAGPYSGAQWSRRLGARYVDNYFGPFEEYGHIYPRGPISGSFRELWVEPTAPASLAVQVRRGSAFVDDYWYHNNAVPVLAIAPNTSGLTRYDRVVLRKLWDVGTIRVVVLSGAPGSGYPALIQTPNIQWEIPLALVTVTTGLGAIVAANITDERQFANDRRIELGLGDFEPDPFGFPGAINVFGGTDSRGWELAWGTTEIVYATVIPPRDWGDSALTCILHIWGYAPEAQANILQIDQVVYASANPAANLVAWGNATHPAAGVYRILCDATITVTPGQILELAISQNNTVTDYYLLGAELDFRRV